MKHPDFAHDSGYSVQQTEQCLMIVHLEDTGLGSQSSKCPFPLQSVPNCRATAAAMARLSLLYLGSFSSSPDRLALPSICACVCVWRYIAGSSGTAASVGPPMTIGIPAKAPFHSLASEYDVSRLSLPLCESSAVLPEAYDALESRRLLVRRCTPPGCPCGWVRKAPPEPCLPALPLPPADEACEWRASGESDRLNGMPSSTLAYPERVESAAELCRESDPGPEGAKSPEAAKGRIGGSSITSSSAVVEPDAECECDMRADIVEGVAARGSD